MKTMTKSIAAASILLMGVGGLSATAQAATFSTTKVELLYGQDFKRGFNGADRDEATLTFANATGFTWGDSYLFLDTTHFDDVDDTGGTHIEFGPRYRFWKAENDGLIKSVYGIVQLDIDSNRFVTKVTKMAGPSIDWNVPGFKFVKTHLQYRDDPTKEGSSVQFNLVWNKGFKMNDQDFSFEGFADWTSPEGPTGGFTSSGEFHVQAQLVWHANESIAVGVEYLYWKNRIGIEGRDESVPQAMVRWTF